MSGIRIPKAPLLLFPAAAAALFLLAGTGWPAGPAPKQGGPVRSEKVPILECKTCHGQKAVLGPDHPGPSDPRFPECRDCHQGKTDLRGRLPLAHLHRLRGVDCSDCHEDQDQPQALEAEQCLACHGPFEELKARTAKADPNPHDSHYQSALTCDACHHAHQKSENFCAQCHNWSLKVP